MGLFNRKQKARVAKISARARYVNPDVQRVDLTVRDADGDSVVLELSLDQTRRLIGDLTISYSACRPSLLSQREAERIANRLGMG